MSLKQAVLQLKETLDKLAIEHALIGGFALSVHGINRATGDIDLLIDEINRIKLIEGLKPHGYAIRAETAEVLHFNGPVRLDVLLARRPISKEMLKRAESTPLLNGVKFLGPEDLIGLKIQAYSNDRRRELQDKADIQFLLQKYPNMDLTRVKFYADCFKEWPTIEGIIQKKR